MTDAFDTIVVGAGSAGCVLASRLSEDAGRRVLLVEAGPVPTAVEGFPSEVLDAGAVAGARPALAVNWRVPGRVAGRDHTTTRGRILGGSSATNGAYFIRPRFADFAEWAEQGGPEWSYAAALPRLIALERDLDYGATALHGGDGPIAVGRTTVGHPGAQAFAAASAALGFPDDPDKNAQDAPGFGPVPGNAVAGVRQNAGLALVLPALDRPNLTVWGDALVTRVAISGGRASGIVARRGVATVEAGAGEVVLAAGAVRSPQLLMLSGVGPADALARLGLPLLLDAPGVGAGLSDHAQLVFGWRPRDAVAAPAGTWMGGVLHAGPAGGEAEVLQSLRPMAALTSGRDVGGAVALLASVTRPRRTGRLLLESAEPDTSPVLDYRYLEDAEERAEWRELARLVASVLDAAAVRDTAFGVDGVPPEVLRDDAALDSWIAAHLGTAMHTAATASFGGPRPVVDPFGRVLGIAGLRVADASILPAAPRRGPAAAALLVGETVAAAIRAGRH